VQEDFLVASSVCVQMKTWLFLNSDYAESSAIRIVLFYNSLNLPIIIWNTQHDDYSEYIATSVLWKIDVNIDTAC
jgi:hypothetical protein